jgi:hypothetical protein
MIGKKGMVFSLLGMLVAFVIIVFLFLKIMNVYFKKSPESNPSPPQVTPGNYEGVLSSMKNQINTATAQESVRAKELQQ